MIDFNEVEPGDVIVWRDTYWMVGSHEMVKDRGMPAPDDIVIFRLSIDFGYVFVYLQRHTHYMGMSHYKGSRA